MSRTRQEPDVISVRTVVLVALAALASFALAILWAALIQKRITGSLRTRQGALTEAGKTEVGLVFQIPFAREELAAEHLVRESERLQRFGWADPQHRTAYIPIERAKQELIARGHL